MSKEKPVVQVLYGQPDHLSTSYQTEQLMRASRLYLDVRERRFASKDTGSFRTQAGRLWSNLIEPLLYQSRCDFVFYGNDGLADLRRWKAPSVIYWYDALWDWTKRPPRPWQARHWWRYQNVRHANYVFAVSAAQVDVARKLRPGREGSVHYLPVGVDCRHYSPANAAEENVRLSYGIAAESVVIGYLGYIAGVGGRFAGQPLIEAASKLASKHRVHFLVVGYGPALRQFEHEVNAQGMETSFTFTGYISPKRLPSFIGCMDICVDTLEPGFHSEARSETKLKQYMAMGRACVATAIGENRVDLDDGRCGCLVAAGKNGLLEGITTLLNDPDKRDNLGQAARTRAVSTYDWPVLARKMSEVLLAN